MHGESSREVVRHLRTLYQFGVAGAFGDEQLLERFLATRDETSEEAFAELVQRHGPMVLGVCRRILGDAHEAEDAFQATFLVLARKAATVVRREKVASWLYGVAVRTAKEARGRAARRRAREERVSAPIHVEPPDDGFPDELRDILDEELARLPARHRGAVVLCELEGLSRPEAARRLGIPEGTLSSRLSRAKARLRDRLARRGVSLPVAALSAILIREARAASLPLSLLESTVQAATSAAAGPIAAAVISASVASLSEGVIKTMLIAKLKGIALAVGTMTAVVSGAVVLAQSGSGPGDGPAAEVGVLRGPSSPANRTSARGDEVDRAAALEKKLDRILDALERLSSKEVASPYRVHGGASGSPPAAPSEPEYSEPVRAASASTPPLRGAPPVRAASFPAPAEPEATVEGPYPVSADQPPPRTPDAPTPPPASPDAPRPPRPPDAPTPPPASPDVPRPPRTANTQDAPPTVPSPVSPDVEQPPRATLVPVQPTGESYVQPRSLPPGTTPAPMPPGPTGPPTTSIESMPLTDRIRNLERQMQHVQQRLDQLTRRLKSLDSRVGGGSLDRDLPAPPPGAAAGPMANPGGMM